MIIKSLLILTASVLISAVNSNTSYCMEEKIENKFDNLNINNNLEKIHDKYISKFDTESKQEIIQEFCEYLFGNDGKNLEYILSRVNESELRTIYCMLYNVGITSNKDNVNDTLFTRNKNDVLFGIKKYLITKK